MSDLVHEDIDTLKFPYCIQKRPGLYIGSTENCDVLFREILDNSVDEAFMTKTCTEIKVEKTKEGYYIIKDNGRGIPTRPSKSNPKITQARLSCSELHAGSKFDKLDMQTGMNGLGSSAVNALSESYIVKTRVTESDAKLSKIEWNKNLFYICKFKNGIFESEEYITDNKEELNTIISFKPNLKFMESDEASLPSSLGYSIYICEKVNKKKLSITINGKDYDGKIQDLKYNLDREIRSNDNEVDYVRFLISCEFQSDFSPCLMTGSVNGLSCDQGLHINSVNKAFTDAFNIIFRRKFGSDSVMRGMQFRVIALANEPNFASQTKERLANIRGFGKRSNIITETLTEEFRKLIKKNMPEFKEHLDKVVAYTNSVDKIGRKELIESKIATMSSSRPDAYLPFKLKDCSSTDRSKCILCICEGESAGGALVRCRDPKYHAVLGTRGKPKNAVSLEIEQALENKEICDILNCIGVGTTDVHDLKKLRYGAIYLCGDMDPDGQVITAILLGNLYTHCEVLFDLGIVYVIESPFYKLKTKSGVEYYYKDEFNKLKGKPFERIKGLGQMEDADIKWSFFANGIRKLKVTKDNYDQAISMLTSSRSRRQIMEDRGVIDPHILGKRGEGAVDTDDIDYDSLFEQYDSDQEMQKLLSDYSNLKSEEDRNEFIESLSDRDNSVLIYLSIRG